MIVLERHNVLKSGRTLPRRRARQADNGNILDSEGIIIVPMDPPR